MKNNRLYKLYLTDSIRKVCLVDKYNEVVCELEEDGFFYKLPKGFLLDIGDEFKVMEIEMEVD